MKNIRPRDIIAITVIFKVEQANTWALHHVGSCCETKHNRMVLRLIGLVAYKERNNTYYIALSTIAWEEHQTAVVYMASFCSVWEDFGDGVVRIVYLVKMFLSLIRSFIDFQQNVKIYIITHYKYWYIETSVNINMS